jgi:hypothetical protein
MEIHPVTMVGLPQQGDGIVVHELPSMLIVITCVPGQIEHEIRFQTYNGVVTCPRFASGDGKSMDMFPRTDTLK